MTTRDPHADYYRARSERVTPENASEWRSRVLGILSSRDRADFERLCKRLPGHMLIRLFGAEYMTSGDLSERDKAMQAYGATIERETYAFMSRLPLYEQDQEDVARVRPARRIVTPERKT